MDTPLPLSTKFYKRTINDIQQMHDGALILDRLKYLKVYYIKLNPTIREYLLSHIELVYKDVDFRFNPNVENCWDLELYNEYSNPHLQLAADWLNFDIESNEEKSDKNAKPTSFKIPD